MWNDINLKPSPPKEKQTVENRIDQDTLTNHFIALAQGYRPERKGKLNLITDPKGGKSEEPKEKSKDKLYMVTPIAQAVQQAQSDLARGVHQPTIYDRVREENAMRRQLERKRKARRIGPAPKIEMISPVDQALAQARSDLKRGSRQMDVLDAALERDAQRKERSEARKVRRRKVYGKKMAWPF